MGRAAVCLVAVSALVSGCDELDEIELGLCGNNVLDPGEDCDGYPHPEGTACAPRGAANACRFICDPSCGQPGIACDAALGCPTGWGCGLDGICRRPAGSFATSLFDLDVPAAPWMELSDFDNDGRDDLAFLDLVAARVVYSEGRERPVDTYRFATTPAGYPEVTDVDRDGFRDLVVPTREGLEVLRGTVEPRLRPGVYPSLQFPAADAAHFVDMELSPPLAPGTSIAGVGDEALVMLDLGFLRASFDDLFFLGVQHPADVADLVGGLVAGAIDETSYADELVAAFAGLDVVHLYRFAAQSGPTPFTVSMDTIGLTEGSVTGPDDLALPFEVGIMGARLVHANPPLEPLGGQSALCCDPLCMVRAPGDEHLDVVVATTAGLQTAYGLGDGTFHSDPCELGAVPPDQLAAKGSPSIAPISLLCEPLRVAELDGDGELDVITATGVWLTTLLEPGQTLCGVGALAAAQPVTAWVRAETGDFNADGNLDVVALNYSRGDIDFILGTGTTAMSHSTISRVELNQGAPQVGDFDGDGADDAAILAAPNLLEPFVQELNVVWGEPGAVPSVIQSLGNVPQVLAMGVSSQRPTGSTNVDGYDDLAIAIKDIRVEDNIAIVDDFVVRFGNLLGRPDREMTMPFKPTKPADSALEPTAAVFSPHAVAAGRFSFADDGAEALVTTVRYETGFVAPTDPAMLAVALSSSGTTAAPPGTSTPLVAGVPGELPGGEVGQRYRAAAVGASDGLQQPVVFEFVDGELATRVHVPRYDPASWLIPEPAVLEAVPLGASVVLDDPNTITVGTFSLFVPNTPLACDLGDPEGEHLLTAMVEDRSHPFIVVSSLDDLLLPTEKRTVLYAFSPADIRAVQDGAASLAPTVVVADDGLTTGFACFDLDGDGSNELLMSSVQLVASQPLTEDQVLLDVGFRLRVHATRYVPSDASGGGGFEPLTTVLEVDEKAIGDLQAGGLAGVPLQGMVSGDVDGDGVQDLVFGAFDTTLVLFGEAVNP